MKKMKSKLMVAVLIGGLLLGQLSVYASAATMCEEQQEKNYYIDGDYVVDSNGYKYSHFVTSNGVELSLEEAVVLLNNDFEYSCSESNDTLPESESSQFSAVRPDLGVTITSIQKNYVGAERRVTPEMIGPGTLSKTVSTTVSASITTSASISASSKALIFAEVKLECGTAISTSVAKTDSYTMSFPISAGKKGAIYFKPYCVKATGRVDNNTFTVICPKIVNGFADGLFYLKES